MLGTIKKVDVNKTVVERDLISLIEKGYYQIEGEDTEDNYKEPALRKENLLRYVENIIRNEEAQEFYYHTLSKGSPEDVLPILVKEIIFDMITEMLYIDEIHPVKVMSYYDTIDTIFGEYLGNPNMANIKRVFRVKTDKVSKRKLK